MESRNIKELICKISGIKINTTNKKHLHILGMYRPPGAPVNDAFDKLITLLDKVPHRNDLNIHNLDDSKRQGNSLHYNILPSNDMTRLILPPTRVTNTPATSIDVVCTNLDANSVDVSILQTGLSDHTGQLTSLNLQAQQKTQLTTIRRHLNVKNLSSLQDLTALQSWKRVYQETQIE